MLTQIRRLFGLTRTDRAKPGERAFFWFPRYEAGKYIDHETALTLGAVFASVRVISEAVASLPWPVLQRASDGSRQRLMGNSVYPVLNRRANRDTSAFSWRETALAHALLWGNHYSEIERDRANRVVGLYPIHPSRVEVKRNDSGELIYEVTQQNAGKVTLPAADVFHLHGLGSDGVVGYSVVSLAARSIGYGIAAEEFGASFYGNGAQLGGIITQESGSLNPVGVKNLLDTFNAKHRGSANAHRVEYLDGGMKYQEIGVKPEDAQFLGSRQFSVTEIARWFRVPPHKLADLERATFSNIEHQSIEFVTDTVMPWCVRLEQEANYKLFGANASPSIYTKIELKGLLRGDLQTRSQFYRELRNMGALSANDIRELEDMDPIGADGDAYLVPLNMTTLDRMVEGEPAAAPEAEAEPEPSEEDEIQAKARLVVLMKKTASHAARHAELARGRYTRQEFFSWREAYFERHYAKALPNLQTAAEALGGESAATWLDEFAHLVKRHMVAVFERSAKAPTKGYPELVDSLIERARERCMVAVDA